MADITKIALFAGGILCGTAGLKLLKSKEAKKVYAHTTAAALRVKECVMTDVTKVREGCGDIMAEAKEINEKKSASDVAEVIEDERE
ncbi:DUF6110 family protein [uncultured Ruminococcus sp.]|uniref:DUF6110 family protein n=1 Tax=uncultured Ruminococcus sp. TaxID=165186 RepID=UPI000EDCC216|nr:DUF6110 family protein [uncultured Ruminococcus sp.]HCJ40256.1 hypothetical protein [Ruminococcus sp.]